MNNKIAQQSSNAEKRFVSSYKVRSRFAVQLFIVSTLFIVTHQTLTRKNSPRMLRIESNPPIRSDANGETLVEPPIAALAVQQNAPEPIQLFRRLQIELERLIVQRQHEGGTLDGKQRGAIDALGENGVANVRPLLAIAGGEGGEALFADGRSRRCAEDRLHLAVV